MIDSQTSIAQELGNQDGKLPGFLERFLSESFDTLEIELASRSTERESESTFY